MCIKATVCAIVFYCGSVPAVAQLSAFHSPISPDSLQKWVSFLASDSLEGRLTGSKGMTIAAAYIGAEFRRAGLTYLPGDTSYQYNYSFDDITGFKNGINVAGILPGRSRPQEIVIFSAHYDHIGTISTSPYLQGQSEAGYSSDTIYNGANDNASGTAAVIALAHYLGKTKINERTILFVCFSGEEFGMRGSTRFVEKLFPEDVVALINIEMIGRGRNRKDLFPFITGDHHSTLRKILNDQLKKEKDSIDVKVSFRRDAYTNESLFNRSDNLVFAKKGIPAHTIMLTPTSDPHYHKVSDEEPTLDYQNMAVIVGAIAHSVTGLIKGDVTPRRINPSALR